MIKLTDISQYRPMRADGADALTKHIEREHAASDDPFFGAGEEATPEMVQLLELRRAALRFVLGMDARSMRAVAAEIGVSSSTFHKTAHDIAKRLGMDFALKDMSARKAMSEAGRQRSRRPKEKPNGVASAGLEIETDHHA